MLIPSSHAGADIFLQQAQNLLLDLESSYPFCALFTNPANPTSNDIYHQIGDRPAAEFNEYRFENH